MNFLKLVGLVSLGGLYSAHAHDDDGFACNSVITTVTVAEIEAIIEPLWDFSYDNTLTDDERTALREIYNTPLKYDVLVSKSCGSCAELMSTIEMADISGTSQFMNFCGPDVYGYDTTHSALVMHPLDPDTGTPLAASLLGHINFQGVRLQSSFAFTSNFPGSNFTQFVNSDVQTMYFAYADLYSALVTASAGRISISPDYMGTGESSHLDRSYLTRMPVEQVAIVSWFAAAAFSEDATNGCTRLLPDSALTSGFSRGGAVAIQAALALQTVGVTIGQLYDIAGPVSLGLNVQLEIAFNFLTPSTPVTPFSSANVAFIVASWSNNSTFLETDTPVASPEYLNASNPDKNVLSWFFEQELSTEELYQVVPATTDERLALLNPILVQPAITAAFAGGYMCDEPYITEDLVTLCQALSANEALGLVPFISFPTTTCHAEDDPIVPYAYSTELMYLFGNPNISPYVPPIDLLGNLTGHGTAQVRCYSAINTLMQQSPPPVDPIALDSDGARCLVYPLCSICGDDDDVSLTNPDALLLFSGDDEPVSCGDFAQSGLDGEIPPALCANMPAAVIEACGCMVATSSPTPAPTMSPTGSPTKSGKRGKGGKGKLRDRRLERQAGAGVTPINRKSMKARALGL